MSSRSKRRSSLYAAPGRENLNQTPIIEQNGVDEEAERRGRVRLQKRQSIGHVIPAAVAGTPVANNEAAAGQTAVSGLSSAQLTDLYSNCMKLSAENKINIKNAFHLQLIDYMAEIMKTKKSSQLDNFQAASCALDASAKIYAYRVDSVHSDTLKLAGGVGKPKDGNNKNNDNPDAIDGEDGNAHDEDDPTKAKTGKRKKKSATIEKNLNNIDIGKFELEFDVDPLFKKTSTQFDSGGGGGQFLCNLYIRDERCQLLLDSDAYLNEVKQPLAEDECQTIAGDLVSKLPKKIEDSAVICPSFNGFSFLNWSVENEDKDNFNFSRNDDDVKEVNGGDKEVGDHAFDANAPPAVDDEDIGGDDYDGGDINDDYEDGGDPDQNRAGGGQRGLGVELLDNLKKNLNAIPSEYSYFDTGRLGAWAGPKHWKFKPLLRPGKTLMNAPGVGPGGDKSKRKPKEITPYDFEDLFKAKEWDTDFDAEPLKKGLKLQNKTMDGWSEDRVMLPADLHYKGKDFAKIFVAEEWYITGKGRVVNAPESVDDSINEYDFDNANDADDFCPAFGGGEMEAYAEDNDNEGGYFPSQTILPTQTQQDGLLVSAPNRVEKIQIGYAKQAKKMDMRRLKAIEWTLLNKPSEQNKENEADNEAKKDNKTMTSEDTVESPVNFGILYKELSTTRMLPPKMVENLSVPLAFVALLHLCNEKSLALESVPDFSDFKIAQG